METLGDKLVAKSGIFVAKKFYCENFIDGAVLILL
jgi:hypothetical protein